MATRITFIQDYVRRLASLRAEPEEFTLHTPVFTRHANTITFSNVSELSGINGITSSFPNLVSPLMSLLAALAAADTALTVGTDQRDPLPGDTDVTPRRPYGDEHAALVTIGHELMQLVLATMGVPTDDELPTESLTTESKDYPALHTMLQVAARMAGDLNSAAQHEELWSDVGFSSGLRSHVVSLVVLFVDLCNGCNRYANDILQDAYTAYLESTPVSEVS